MFIYFKDQSYIYFYTEMLCVVALGASLILLIRGLTQYSVGTTFILYGNFFLLRAVIFPEFVIFGSFPFSPEIYHAFQAIIIITVGYFSKKIQGVIVTVVIGFVVNIFHVTFNHPMWISRFILSSVMFIILPSIFSFYIFRSKQLLYKYYKSNLQKDREINHRIKNHLTILKSMLNLESSCNEYQSETTDIDLQAILDSFISVYDQLSHSENVQRVNLYSYLTDLLTQYKSSLPLNFNLVQNNRKIYISSDNIIHFGMVCSELIANSLKHADTENLIITLKIDTTPTDLIFQYSDSGKPKQDIQQLNEPGFGQSIIKMIIESTLEGKSEIDYTNGFTFTASIPLSAIMSLEEF